MTTPAAVYAVASPIVDGVASLPGPFVSPVCGKLIRPSASAGAGWTRLDVDPELTMMRSEVEPFTPDS